MPQSDNQLDNRIDASPDTVIEDSLVTQDKIIIGNIQGSNFAIGTGAKVIINQVRTAVEVAKRDNELEQAALAEAVIDYINKLDHQVEQSKDELAEIEPYKALLPYRLADASLFFGRNQAKRDLLTSVAGKRRGPLTVLHSVSGSGKTSLLQAGLAATLLADEHLPLYVRPWRKSPTEAIKHTLLPNMISTPNLAQVPLRTFLLEVLRVLNPKTTLFILLDQFEEFFLLGDEAQRESFIDELGECIDDETLRVRFVLSIRSDRFANLSEFRSRIPTIFANEYTLKPLTVQEAEQAIRQPAALASLIYAPNVVPHLVNELQRQDGQQTHIIPAQLQLVCWALFSSLGENHQTITQATVEEMGGVPGILRNYLKQVVSREIIAEQRDLAHKILEALVRSDRTRDIKTTTELARLIGSQQELPEVLKLLVISRLLRVIGDETSNEDEAYELAHDYLIPQIELDPKTIARKVAQELLDQEVEAYQRNLKFLITGEKLKTIEGQENNLYFSVEAEELYRRSKTARWWNRITLRGLIIGVLLALCSILSLCQSLNTAQGRLDNANNALVTATKVIFTAQEEAAIAAASQATAQSEQATAEVAEATAVAAGATADVARSTAEARQGTAVSDLGTAEAAEATAIAAEVTAGVARSTAEARQGTAVSEQATAEAASAQAAQAQATAAASQATAEAGEELAISAEQTAQAERAAAEAAAQEAAAAAEQARQAQAAAEAAQAAAKEAEKAAEEAARQAERDKLAAEEAARNAEATRVAVEIEKEVAEQTLAETERVAAIVRKTVNCPTGMNPRAITFDGTNIWVTNLADNTVTKFIDSDCNQIETFSTGSAPTAMISGNGAVWIANRFDNTIQKIDIATGITTTLSIGLPGKGEPTALLFQSGIIWVASDKENLLHKFDPNTSTILASYNTQDDPTALTFDGTYIWVANASSNTVSRIDSTTGATTIIAVGARPVSLSYDGNFVWVVNRNNDTLTKIQASDGTVMGTFSTPNFPDDVIFADRNIWTANMDDNSITRLDPNTGTILSEVATGRTPTAMVFDGGNMWVVAEDDNLVQKIPITIQLTDPEPVDLIYDGTYLWTANKAGNTITKLAPNLNEQPRSFSVGQEPVGLVSTGAYLWIINQVDDTVSKVRVADGMTLEIFAVGNKPIAITYDGTYIWVVNENDDTLTRLNEANGTSVSFGGMDDPVDILYDGTYIWVTNEGDDTLVKLDSDGTPIVTYSLSQSPRSFLYDGIYFWVGYTDIGLTTSLLQIRASDGMQISDTSLANNGSPVLAYDGTYLWVTSPSSDIVTRVLVANPTVQTAFPVCDKPSALFYANNEIWLACQDDDLIQKLPTDVEHVGIASLPLSPLSPDSIITHLYLPLIFK